MTGDSPTSEALSDLDDLTHQRVRLGVLALLSRVGALDFTRIRDDLGTTDGNLSRHLSALEQAGYITQEKKGSGTKSRTWISITSAGADSLRREATALRQLLGHLDD